MVSSNELTRAIAKRLGTRRLFYVCRDLERAVGDCLKIKNYRIITNENEFSRTLAKQHSNIILISYKNQLDTSQLLQHPKTKRLIKKTDFVLVFKNNQMIENICKERGWKLLNPNSKLAEKVENKISQIAWLEKLEKYLPAHRLDLCENIEWRGEPFIVQFNHSHTGSGTFLIDSKKHLDDLQQKFPKRQVRIMEYIKGHVFTNNNIVWEGKTLIGNISYQITGLSPFTDSKFATIGNDWALPTQLLNIGQIKQYKKIVTDLGEKLGAQGWKGLFGVDIIVDEKTGQLYLLEINSRQPASTTFESQLEKKEVGIKKLGITTFEAHLASLLDLPYKAYELIPINNGAQIIQRVTQKISTAHINLQHTSILSIIKYANSAPDSDLVRIQSSEGIMAKENSLNKLGKLIRTSLC
jgi:predicted ATP-grasp superfamily ATP-dependent carboligase